MRKGGESGGANKGKPQEERLIEGIGLQGSDERPLNNELP